VFRLTRGGCVMQPEECMGVQDALALYTTSAAYAGGQLPRSELPNGCRHHIESGREGGSGSGREGGSGGGREGSSGRTAFKIGRLEAGWEAGRSHCCCYVVMICNASACRRTSTAHASKYASNTPLLTQISL
jgi:hypothetical protein